MSDPIADLLVRIRNAVAIGKAEITLPSSRLKEVILGILKNEGYIQEIKSVKKNNFKYLTVSFSKEKLPTHLKQISKPGQRIYVKNRDIPKPLRGLGLVIVSTSVGVIPGRDAIKRGLGGELICEVW
ncbi:MAG: 30S ribosomal protein S8 [Patescibacteria group bacterium]|jgi:small subunit ribosomal protein S8